MSPAVAGGTTALSVLGGVSTAVAHPFKGAGKVIRRIKTCMNRTSGDRVGSKMLA